MFKFDAWNFTLFSHDFVRGREEAICAISRYTLLHLVPFLVASVTLGLRTHVSSYVVAIVVGVVVVVVVVGLSYSPIKVSLIAKRPPVGCCRCVSRSGGEGECSY